jgi:hypothetical protein
MQLYRIYDADLPEEDRKVSWRGTAAAAQVVMKQTNEQFRCCIQVDLVDAPNDKDNFLWALCGEPENMHGVKVLKSWRGTARGGLKEVADEAQSS